MSSALFGGQILTSIPQQKGRLTCQEAEEQGRQVGEPGFKPNTFGLTWYPLPSTPEGWGELTPGHRGSRESTQPSRAGEALSGGVLVGLCVHSKVQRTGWLKQSKCIFSLLEARAPRSRCRPLGVGSGEGAPSGLEVVASCPHPHVASCLWGPRPQGSLPLPIGTAIHQIRAPPLHPSNLIAPLKAVISKYDHLGAAQDYRIWI